MIEKVNSNILELKKLRAIAVKKQKDCYKRAVDDVRFLVSEFESLVEISQQVESECKKAEFSTLDEVERIANAQENLTNTVDEIDRYRRLPKIVTKLSEDLKTDPVRTLPRAHYEYRSMVSWCHHSTVEWKEASKTSSINKKYTNMIRMVENKQYRQVVEEVIGNQADSTRILNKQWRDNVLTILADCFDLATTAPNYLVLVADIIETSERQHSMVVALSKSLRTFVNSTNADTQEFDPEAEIETRGSPLGIVPSYRLKCLNTIKLATDEYCKKQFRLGVQKYQQQEHGDGDTASDVDRLEEYEFEELMSGLNYVSEGILNDSNNVSICFPPWYDVFGEIIYMCAKFCCHFVQCEIVSHQAGEEWNILRKDDGSKDGNIKDVASATASLVSRNTNESGQNEEEGGTKVETNQGKTLSNDCIMQVVEWLRSSADDWEINARKREYRIDKHAILDPRNVRRRHWTTACRTMSSLASKFVVVYMKRTENNVERWTRQTALKVPTAEDVDFFDDRMPRTTAPRDLCRLLDDQYRIVVNQRGLETPERIFFSRIVMQYLGMFGTQRCRPKTLFWLKHFDIDNKLIILCAMIHDNDFLLNWIDTFFENVEESDWLASGVDLESSKRLEADHSDSGEYENSAGRESCTQNEQTLAKQIEDLEEMQSTKILSLIRGQQFYADAISIAVISTLNNGILSNSTKEWLMSIQVFSHYLFELFPSSPATTTPDFMTTSIFDTIFTKPWMVNDTYTAESICKTLLDFLRQDEYDQPTVFSMLGEVKQAKNIARVVNNILICVGKQYMSKFLDCGKHGSKNFLAARKARKSRKNSDDSVSNFDESSPAALRLEMDCDQLLECFNKLKSYLPSSAYLQKWKYPINVENEFGRMTHISKDDGDECESCGRVRCLVELLNIHIYIDESDPTFLLDLFATVQHVQKIHEDVDGLQLILIAINLSVKLTSKQKLMVRRKAQEYWSSRSVWKGNSSLAYIQ